MKATLRNILIVGVILLFLLALWYFRNIVVYILVSGVLSIMGRPLVDLLCSFRVRNIRLPRALGALITLAVIWGLILLFFMIFVPLVTRQINYFSAIDSETLVKIVESPLDRIQNLLGAFNKDISNELSVKEYISGKVSEILNINMIQNFLGSMIDILGNLAVAVFSISFITFFFLKDQHLFFESILMWVPDPYVDNVTRALNSIKNLLTRYFIGILIQSTCIMILITLGMTIV
ncbi:MAG TPA: AI-2E family transporter, partial [Synergistales bacterium]|nr:AI-2E family transporter [Synergistales bacterium]